MVKKTYKVTVICVLMVLDRTYAILQDEFLKPGLGNLELEFYNAAYLGNVGYIKQALAEGTIDINWKNDHHYGRTALVGASYANQREVVRLLLEAGALVDEQNMYGCTALHFASSYDSTDGVPSFFTERVNTYYQKDDTPEFKPSLFQEQVSIVKMLIEANANVNIADYWGLTPLHWAATVNKKENVQELLDNGANPMARTWGYTDNDLTPADLARERSNFEIAKYIEAYSSGTALTRPTTIAQEPTTASAEMYILESTATTAPENKISLLRKLIIILVQNM